MDSNTGPATRVGHKEVVTCEKKSPISGARNDFLVGGSRKKLGREDVGPVWRQQVDENPLGVGLSDDEPVIVRAWQDVLAGLVPDDCVDASLVAVQSMK